MKSLSNMRLVVLVLLALVLGGGRAAAATVNSPFFIFASNSTTNLGSTNVYFTNSPVITTITVSTTNAYPASITYVTNTFSEPIIFGGIVSNSFSTNISETAEGNNVYLISLLNSGTNTTSQIIFAWLPLTTGPVTNLIQAGLFTQFGLPILTNSPSTNLVINQVYGGSADLAVSNYLISQAYITNDWVITNDYVTYGVVVTNMGPQTTSGVNLTNQLPAGFRVVSASAGYTNIAGTNLVFSLGTLTNGGYAKFQFTVAPTNTGAFGLIDTVSTPGTYDPNSANNTAIEPLSVTNYLNDGTLVAGTNAAFPQKVNAQNGLIEQNIEVTNTAGKTVQAVRLVLTGLTNQLYNASGTNNGEPFVTYPVTLGVGATVNLRLQYDPRLPFSFTNGQLQVYEVPTNTLNYTPRPVSSTVNTPNFDFARRVADNFAGTDILLEFTNTGASSFTIVYSTNANFSNAMIVPPAISSTATRIQWEDFGPPATISPPTTGVRYYRVMANP